MDKDSTWKREERSIVKIAVNMQVFAISVEELVGILRRIIHAINALIEINFHKNKYILNLISIGWIKIYNFQVYEQRVQRSLIKWNTYYSSSLIKIC